MKNQIDAFDELHNILPDTSVIEQYEYEELGKLSIYDISYISNLY